MRGRAANMAATQADKQALAATQADKQALAIQGWMVSLGLNT